MERYNTSGEVGLEIFTNFVGKTKEAFVILGENIKANIKKYEQSIEMTERDIFDSKSAREKCEHEISRMEDKISTIKEAIDNVESTYKKIVDAYSSTSKGITKEIYTDVIAAARANCEEDVERNRTEFAKLNSDIEGIKNNIAEFTRVIDSLNKNLENYKSELSKYTKASAYLDETRDIVISDLEDIADNRDVSGARNARKEKPRYNETPKYSFETKSEDNRLKIEPKRVLENKIERSYSFEEAPETKKSEVEEKKSDVDESLQRLYDLTGYKPKKEEKPVEEKSIFADKALFGNEFDTVNVFDEPASLQNNASNLEINNQSPESFTNNSMSEWENILNGGDSVLDLQNGATVNIPIISEPETNANSFNINNSSNIEEANELLKPYGTSYEKITSLAAENISYKNGQNISVKVTTDDLIKAVNSIDSLDLKSIQTIGPEVTLLRKVKHMKEGMA